MHQNEELLQIDCSMEKEEGENRTLVRGFLWLLHFKVTKVGNWLEAVVVPKTCWGKTKTIEYDQIRYFTHYILLEIFSCVDCILQCTKMSLSAKFTYVLT